jgi:hypothetical protein
MKRNPILPLVLAVITFGLLALALWPQEEPTVPVVVAAVDLGAGTLLSPADLKSVVMPVESAPADSISDPALLVGQSLSVVRYAGEPVTPRHLGPAVVLAPDERGIAVRVAADTGLAGLLRPGMEVGVVATLPLPSTDRHEGATFAKSTLEGLRVLYVPPSFQARPLSAQVYPTEDGVYAPPPPEPASEGVIVLAAGTLPEPVVYEAADAILQRTLTEGEEPADAQTPPTVTWAVPVELLAALNAAGASFTLVLVPEDALPYTSPGFDVTALTEQPLAASR